MKTYQYTCTLQSDLIISSLGASEGQHKSLDFIPGSKFLGIVAGDYEKLPSEEALEIFHSGKIVFGNAYPKVENHAFLPVPAAYFFPKGKSLEDQILLPMNLKPNQRFSEDIQPKQARGGYFNFPKKQLFKPGQNFRLKSAFDSENRRSKEGQMFGYFSLPKGLIMHFSIKDSTGKYADQIKTKLEGIKRIGRSKSAEYGLVEIKFDREQKGEKEPSIPINTNLVVYAEADLCFLDSYGQFTGIPTGEDITGSIENVILWDKSQVRTRKYPVWNGKRQSKEADRIVIEKGSVFIIKINTAIPDNFYENGIGVLKSEGYGQVILNPDFIPLDSDQLKEPFSKPTEYKNQPPYSLIENLPASESLISALKNRKSADDINQQVKLAVDQFIKESKSVLRDPNKSQWGTIRGYAKQSANFDAFWKMTFGDELGFIHRGKSENQWRKAGEVLKNKLKDLKNTKGEAFVMDFIQKLASEMPKIK
ncbi:hypothetical protein [Algoriphagus sp.]|uniref:hypothetical protein n=1 Tax=Algoriphagus sp. TaxID=1872435 RepID=UPI00391CB979